MRLEDLLHEEPVQAGDVIFVPAGTVHAIGSGIFLYELQEYSDVTYRMYDYGRLTPAGTLRELHVERALDVASYDKSSRIKMKPMALAGGPGYEKRCLVACQFFGVREPYFNSSEGGESSGQGKGSFMDDETGKRWIILSDLWPPVQVS